MSYSDLLKDPRWQRKRLEVLNRENWTCQECYGTDKTLHVHHTIYRKGAKPWEYEDSELRCVCEDCHASVEEELTELREIIGEFGQSPFGGRWKIRVLLAYARGLQIRMQLGPDEEPPETELPTPFVFVQSPELMAYFDCFGVDASTRMTLLARWRAKEMSSVRVSELLPSPRQRAGGAHA